MSDADDFLRRLKAEPALLPMAPATDPAAAIEQRRHEQAQGLGACRRCGQRAQVAYVAATEIGNRWLDLCAECAEWLRANVTE